MRRSPAPSSRCCNRTPTSPRSRRRPAARRPWWRSRKRSCCATADLAARRDNALAAQAQIAAAGSAREVLKAQVKVLQTQLKDASQQLAYNKIVAPVAGRIGKRSVEVGARLQPGQ